MKNGGCQELGGRGKGNLCLMGKEFLFKVIKRFWNQIVVLCTQSCPTLCDPTDRSPPGSPVHEFLPVHEIFPVHEIPLSMKSPLSMKFPLSMKSSLFMKSPCPWNTGVGCHFLLQIVEMVTQYCECNLCHWDVHLKWSKWQILCDRYFTVI